MTRPTPRVVCIGIATIDAIVEVDRLPASDERRPAVASALAGGGVAATAAVTLARLGVRSAVIAAVGDDRTGRWIRDDLAGEGVDVSGVRLVAAARSPLSVVLVERRTGARALVPDLGDAGPLELGDRDLAACAAADWVHVDQAGAALLPALKAAGIRTPISLDDGVGAVGLTDLGGVELYGPTADVLGRQFAGLDPDAALAAALEAGPRLVVATRGGGGAIAVERAPRSGAAPIRHDVPAWPVAVRSTLGAGDVFHGALLAGLVEGRSVRESLERAAACAALSCRGLDGRSAIPTAAELDGALASRAWDTAATGAVARHPAAGA
jgi:sulfofructose kinase